MHIDVCSNVKAIIVFTAACSKKNEWEDNNGIRHVTAWSKEVRNVMLRGGAEYQKQRVLDCAGTNWNKNFLLSVDAGRQDIRQ